MSTDIVNAGRETFFSNDLFFFLPVDSVPGVTHLKKETHKFMQMN